ncbi:ORF6N domain-containing protein [Flavobacterium laiguense]|uniref:DNA-binding protein n=1 Tax=Flavobacterium laiguense TaxID=2169409 RepID=A0A2U1JPE1_9FLAO|nr:ORF6N domain-containing protein [Flavobacterium laiguense]PWA07002.1 DNA-binding protein [Flavobacterium laiguense]
MLLITIQNKIYEVNGVKIMLDFDLAELYEVETRVLNQAIKRNIESFPEDFMFRLTKEEWENMLSQSVITSSSSQIVMMNLPKNRTGKYLPYAFTEHGVTMLASVLKSSKARKMNIAIVRAFIALRKTLLNIENFQSHLQELETRYDKQFEDIFEAIQFLITDNEIVENKSERVKIGYKK